MKDLVSIVCTLYNYKNYIGDLIQSVLKQTYTNWELFIIDDGSTDNPKKVISKFTDKRIQYTRLDKNYGYSKAKNEGIIKSKGSYIALIDADDMLTKDSIEVRYTYLKKSNKMWLHTRAFNLKGSVLEKENSQHKRATNLYQQSKFPIYYGEYIHAQTVLVKREFYKKLGLYDESLLHSSDKEMWMRALTLKIIPEYINNITAIYRIHPKQMHKSKFKQQTRSQYTKLIINRLKLLEQNGISPENTRMLFK